MHTPFSEDFQHSGFSIAKFALTCKNGKKCRLIGNTKLTERLVTNAEIMNWNSGLATGCE